MKIILYINLLCYLTTLALYIFDEAASGLIAQFFLGIFHLVIGLVFLSKSYYSPLNYYVKIYWGIVIVYFVLISIILCISPDSNSKIYAATLGIIIPMLIATYHLFINYKLQKS